jgi:ketosteroid isomerase-like protein
VSFAGSEVFLRALGVKKMRSLVLLRLYDMKTFGMIVALLGLLVHAHAQTPWQTLVGTEQAFAQQAQNGPVGDAFLAYMSDSAKVYSKGDLVPAKPFWQTNKVDGQLVWGPDYALVSTAGDIGLTSGPWFITKDGKQTSMGYFNTIWKQQPDGTYSFLLDLGTEFSAEGIQIPAKASTPVIPLEKTSSTTSELLEMDASLSKSIRRKGPQEAYVTVMSEEVRLFRPGHAALFDKNWILSFLTKEPKYDFEGKKAILAKSGDVGYVVGTMEGKRRKGIYLRVWKHEARFGWRLSTEVLSYQEEN